MPTGHAKLSASSAHRWLACPGSIRMADKYPEEAAKSSFFADEGTTAHWAAEQALHAPGSNLWDLVGKTCPDTGMEVTKDMLDNISRYVGYCRLKIEGGGEFAVEKQFSLDFIKEGMFGTNDFSSLRPFESLTIVDLKYGVMPVSPVDNPQLMYYGLGAAHDVNYDVDSINLVIVQPRSKEKRGPNGVHEHKISIEQLKNWRDTVLIPGVEATEDPDAPLVAGDHCKYCPAAGKCSAQADKAQEVAKLDFRDDFSDEIATGVIDDARDLLPRAEDLTKDEVVNILSHADMLREFLKAVEAHAHDLYYNEGEDITGYKVVQKLGNRKFTDPDTVAKTLANRKVSKKETHTEPKLKTPAQLEKVLAAHYDDKEKAEKLVKSWCTRPDNGTALVKETARGDAVRKPKPADDFDELPSEPEDDFSDL